MTTDLRQIASFNAKRLLSLVDLSVLMSLACIILYTVSKHEPWADEAQSWLIARDLPYSRMIFSELRYEGHPALWYTILWPLSHVFKLPYEFLGYIGATFAIAGLAVLIFLAPFPRLVRYLIASSFFLAYQYAAVARSYNLLPLLAFLAAYLFRQGLSRVVGFAIALALLIQVSVHGALIGVVMLAFYGLRVFPQWSQLPSHNRRGIVTGALIAAISLVVLVLVVYPPADAKALADATESFSLTSHLALTAASLISAFSNSLLVGCLFLLVAFVWALQRKGLLLMLPSVVGTAAVYGFLRGTLHHIGLALIAFLVSIWIIWPDQKKLCSFSAQQRTIHTVFVVCLIVIFGWQATWSYRAIRNDWEGAYCGARTTADFLKSVNAEQRGCSAFLYSQVAVAAYFDHNIFENLGGPNSPSYFHHGLSYERQYDRFPSAYQRSSFVVMVLDHLGKIEPLVSQMHADGYALVSRSDGWRFFENTAGLKQTYLVFQRNDAH